MSKSPGSFINQHNLTWCVSCNGATTLLSKVAIHSPHHSSFPPAHVCSRFCGHRFCITHGFDASCDWWGADRKCEDVGRNHHQMIKDDQRWSNSLIFMAVVGKLLPKTFMANVVDVPYCQSGLDICGNWTTSNYYPYLGFIWESWRGLILPYSSQIFAEPRDDSELSSSDLLQRSERTS